MKKIYFYYLTISLILLHTSCLQSLYSQSDFSKIGLKLYSNFEGTFYKPNRQILYTELQNQNEEKFSEKNSYGACFYFPGYEARFFCQNEQLSAGSQMFLNPFNSCFPLVLKAGNLSCTGGTSKFKNPEISKNITPFSSNSCSPYITKAFLPNGTSWSNQLSCFISGTLKVNNAFFNDFQFSFWENPIDKQTVLQMYKPIMINKKNKIYFCINTGSFYCTEKNFISWFSFSDSFQPERIQNCINIQAGYNSPKIKASASSILYENQYGKICPTFRIDNKINFNNKNWSFSAFYNPQKIYVPVNNSIPEELQLKGGFQNKSIIKYKYPLFLKTGITALYIQTSENNINLKTAAGLQLFSADNNLTCTTAFSHKLTGDVNYFKTEMNSANFKIQDSVFLGNITPSVNASLTLRKNEQETEKTVIQKYGINLNINRRQKLSWNNSFTITDSKKNRKEELDSSIKIITGIKNISCTIKCSARFHI